MPNLFPAGSTTVTQTTEATSAQIKFGRSYQFDFDAGEFVMTPTGKVADVKDHDAWLAWCKKAVNTERYRYLVYSRKYGQEFEDLISHHLTRAANESEIKRMVTEALKVDPRTAKVDNFQFTWKGDQCFFCCDVTSVRNQSGTIQSVVNV